MSEQLPPPRSGRRVVYWIFLGALLLAVAFGFFVGTVILDDAALSVGVLSVEFRPTPLNMAAYGGISVLVIGLVAYGLMWVASRRESSA